jgi:uncharacterized membrane protein
LLAGGAFAAAPAARALLMNPIPPMVMGSMLYVLKYIEKSKPFDKNELVKWVAISSLIATIAIPQLIAGVKRGNFVGGEYSGLKPGTVGYTVASFFVWAVMILPMIKSRFESAAEEVVEGEQPAELSEAEKKIAIFRNNSARTRPVSSVSFRFLRNSWSWLQWHPSHSFSPTSKVPFHP